MRIELKLGGEFKRYAPGSGGMATLDSDNPMTVSEAMEKIGMEENADDILAIVNDKVVPPSERQRFTLNDQDRLTLIPQLKGG